MNNLLPLTVITLLLAVPNLYADWWYVAPGSTYSNIQQAVDLAAPGDEIDVDDGVYLGGVVVGKPLTLVSLNGPEFTVIDGGRSLTCVSLGDGASLTGFTLTNGYAVYGAGVSCASPNAVLTNCTLIGNFAWGYYPGPGGYGGGACGGTLYDCTLSDNVTVFGGSLGFGSGAYGSTLYNCTLTGNSGGTGSGACQCTLYNCSLTYNSARGGGAGAYQSTLYNCDVSGNYAGDYLGHAIGVGAGVRDCILYNCTVTGNSTEFGQGGGAAGGTLYNCTIGGNSAGNLANRWGGVGGGTSGSTLYNCTLGGNRAYYGWGGGADGGSLYNCTVVGNTSSGSGGGTYMSTLYNCTVTGNSAANDAGGGAYSGTLYNTILYNNTATSNMNYYGSSLHYCCTTPLPGSGVGNITNAPLFVGTTGGNLRLQSNSPCINAGNNSYVTTDTDLDGNPRIVGGTVDIGAYECQSPALLNYYTWLQGYGLPTDASAACTDSDADGMNNWQEWVCCTCPTNALSALCLLSAAPAGTNVAVSWQSVAGVKYFLARSSDLSSPFACVATNITGQAGTTTYSDTDAAGAGPFYYRVGVSSP